MTSALNNLRGQFFTGHQPGRGRLGDRGDAGAVVFFMLQKQFVSGLTLGATKG